MAILQRRGEKAVSIHLRSSDGSHNCGRTAGQDTKACCLTVSSLTCLLLEDMMKQSRADIEARQGLAKTESVQATLMLDAFELLVQLQFWQGPGCLHVVGKATTSFASVKMEELVRTSVHLGRSCSRILK